MRAARGLTLGLSLATACSTSYGTQATPVAPPPLVSIAPSSLTFGVVDCGTTSAQKTLTLTNGGATATTYEVRLPGGTAVSIVGPSKGSLAAGAAATVVFQAAPSVAGDTSADAFVIAGTFFQRVHVDASGRGGVLAFQPPVAAFDTVRASTGASSAVALVNTGNAAVDVTGFTPGGGASDFNLSYPGTIHVVPGTPSSLGVTVSAGPAGGAMSGSFTPTVSGTLCGGAPTLAVQAERADVDAVVTAADFGILPCGAAAPQRTLVVSSYAASAVTATATLGPDSVFAFAGAKGIELAPSNGTTPTTAEIALVARPPAQPATIDEEVDVTMSGGLVGTVQSHARVTVQGAALAFTPSSLLFGSVASEQAFSIANTGNVDVSVGYLVGGSDAWAAQGPTNLLAGTSSAGGSVHLGTLAGAGAANLTVQLSGGGPLCGPSPTLALTPPTRE